MEINQTTFMRYEDCLGFALGFKLSGLTDLSKLIKHAPQSVVFCTTRIVAGNQHVYSILSQAHESAKRGILLARSRSIDLLMRITCQSQITEAIAISEISKTDKLAIFGFVSNESEVDQIKRIVSDEVEHIDRNDDLLLLTKEKSKFLKQLHRLPAWLSNDQLLVALKERSALLIFDR